MRAMPDYTVGLSTYSQYGIHTMDLHFARESVFDSDSMYLCGFSKMLKLKVLSQKLYIEPDKTLEGPKQCPIISLLRWIPSFGGFFFVNDLKFRQNLSLTFDSKLRRF